MDEVYRKYRIVLTVSDRWWAKISHVRGNAAPFSASAALEEGAELCMHRARKLVDEYVEFLNSDALEGDED